VATAWDDLDLIDVGDGRYTTKISEDWQLAVAAQAASSRQSPRARWNARSGVPIRRCAR
jgi:hypothetical protein